MATTTTATQHVNGALVNPSAPAPEGVQDQALESAPALVPLADRRALATAGSTPVRLAAEGLAAPRTAVFRGQTSGVTLAASQGSKQTEAAQKLKAAKERVAKLNQQIDALAAAVNSGMGAPNGGYTGTSQAAAAQAKTVLTQLQATRSELQKIVADIDKQMQPNGFERFFRGDSAYNDVIAMLTESRLSVARGSAIYGALSPRNSPRSLSASFDQILGTLERSAQTAATQAATLSGASARINRTLDTQTATLGQLTTRAAALSKHDEFALSGFSATEKAITARITAIRGTAQRDPLAATADTSASDALAAAQRLVEASEKAQGPTAAHLATSVQALTRAGIAVDWIEKETQSLTTQANAAAARGGQADFVSSVTAYEQGLDAFAKRVENAGSLATAMLGADADAIAKADAAIASTRTQLAAKLKVSATALLGEQGFNPADSTRQARTELRAVADALGKGDIAAATAAQKRAHDAVAQAQALLTTATDSAQNHGATVTKQRARLQQLRTTAEQRGPVVARIERDYADSVAKPERQRLDASNSALSSTETAITRADARFGTGGIIGAARALESTQQTLDQTSGALDTIAESDANLQRADRDNSATLQRLQSDVNALIARSQGANTRPATREALNTLRVRIASQSQAITVRGREPGQVAAQLGQLNGEVAQAQQRIASDAAAYNRAVSEIRTAQNVLLARALFRRDGSFAAQYIIWSSLLGGLEARLASGDYEGVASQARTTQFAIIALANEIEEREAREAAARRRAAEEAAAAERRRQEEANRRNSSSGDGFGSSRSSSGDGFGSSSGDGFGSSSGDGF